MAHTEGTASLTSIQRPLDVVLEQVGCAVVGETLAKLDNSDQERGLGNGVANAAESLLFLFCGKLPLETIVFLDHRGRVGGGLKSCLLVCGRVCSNLWPVGQRLSSQIVLLVGEIRLVESLVQTDPLSIRLWIYVGGR